MGEMSIYPVRRTRRTHSHYVPPSGSGEMWIEEVETPGLVRSRSVLAGAWTEVRTDCFCCTCGDHMGSDSACRNHGYYGKRPCEKHGMPGYAWEGTDEMPESVEVEWAKQAEIRQKMGDV